MKKIFTIIPCLMLLLCSCGHNLVTNYKVKGLDLSFPIAGYPVGIRIGAVDMNTNAIRGNSAYTMHEDTSKVGGTIQTARVVQFSANTQLNERNIVDVLNNDDLEVCVKTQLLAEFSGKNTAPELPDSSVKTPSTSSAISDKYKIHKSQDFDNVDGATIPSTGSFFGNIFTSLIMKTLKDAFGAFFMGTYVGRIIIYTLRALVYILVILLMSSLIKKMFKAIMSKTRKRLNDDEKDLDELE